MPRAPVSAIPHSDRRPTCEACRQRKVRCNRKLPCSHCARLRLSCVYKERSRRAPLVPGCIESSSPSNTVSPSVADSAERSFRDESSGDGHSNEHILRRLDKVEELLTTVVAALSRQSQPATLAQPAQAQPHSSASLQVTGSSRQILLDGGEKGNYLDDPVFVDLLLDGAARRAPGTNTTTQRLTADDTPQDFGILPTTEFFGLEKENVYLSAEACIKLWAAYVQNVDPVMKILHLPTMQAVIFDAIGNLRAANTTTLALVYAIFFSAAASMSREEVTSQLDLDRLALLRFCSRKMDEALRKAQFLISRTIQALQALVIYLVGYHLPVPQRQRLTKLQTALRTHDTSRSVWILVGVAIRLAESLGVHQYGARLGLSPFETEMRCRLWWHLTILDATAPDDHGFNTTLVDRAQCWRLPLNVNDTDLFPQMTELPAERAEWTDASFTIANLDTCRSLRQAVATAGAPPPPPDHDPVGAIQAIECAIAARHFHGADPASNALRRAGAGLLHIAALKARFLLGLRAWLSASHTTMSTTTSKNRRNYAAAPAALLGAATELLETARAQQLCAPQFAWFFRQQQPQLHALALVLYALRDAPAWDEAERAWNAADGYFAACLRDVAETSGRMGKPSCLWAALAPLRERVREARRRGAAGGEGGLCEERRGEGQAEAEAEGAGGVGAGDAAVVGWMQQGACEGDLFSLEHLGLDGMLDWPDSADWCENMISP